jgi:hypothetical protein
MNASGAWSYILGMLGYLIMTTGSHGSLNVGRQAGVRSFGFLARVLLGVEAVVHLPCLGILQAMYGGKSTPADLWIRTMVNYQADRPNERMPRQPDVMRSVINCTKFESTAIA